MGLKIVIQQHLKPIIIETDAHAIISMFNSTTMQYINLINDCRLLLLQLDSPPLQYIYREQNCVTDSLVKYGVMHAQESCILFGRPPPFAKPSYQQDQNGTLQGRLITTNSSASTQSLSISNTLCNSSVLPSIVPSINSSVLPILYLALIVVFYLAMVSIRRPW